jgi:hypothetical protein
MSEQDKEPASWRPDDWLRDAGHPFSKPILYREIDARKIDARKYGRNTIILTSPRSFLETLPKGSWPAPSRWTKSWGKK